MFSVLPDAQEAIEKNIIPEPILTVNLPQKQRKRRQQKTTLRMNLQKYKYIKEDYLSLLFLEVFSLTELKANFPTEQDHILK